MGKGTSRAWAHHGNRHTTGMAHHGHGQTTGIGTSRAWAHHRHGHIRGIGTLKTLAHQGHWHSTGLETSWDWTIMGTGSLWEWELQVPTSHITGTSWAWSHHGYIKGMGKSQALAHHGHKHITRMGQHRHGSNRGTLRVQEQHVMIFCRARPISRSQLVVGCAGGKITFRDNVSQKIQLGCCLFLTIFSAVQWAILIIFTPFRSPCSAPHLIALHQLGACNTRVCTWARSHSPLVFNKKQTKTKSSDSSRFKGHFQRN